MHPPTFLDSLLHVAPHKECQAESAGLVCRYAIAEGFLSAATPAERAVALTAALQRLKATNDWLDTERFMRPRLIRAWGHVVSATRCSCEWSLAL